MTKHMLLRQPGSGLLRSGPRGAEKDASRGEPAPEKLPGEVRGKHFPKERLGQMFPTSFSARPGSSKPSFWCCYLLRQNVELFKRHWVPFVAIQLP